MGMTVWYLVDMKVAVAALLPIRYIHFIYPIQVQRGTMDPMPIKNGLLTHGVYVIVDNQMYSCGGFLTTWQDVIANQCLLYTYANTPASQFSMVYNLQLIFQVYHTYVLVMHYYIKRYVILLYLHQVQKDMLTTQYMIMMKFMNLSLHHQYLDGD